MNMLKVLLHKRYFINYLRIIKYYKLNLKWNINRDNKIFALLKIPWIYLIENKNTLILDWSVKSVVKICTGKLKKGYITHLGRKEY